MLKMAKKKRPSAAKPWRARLQALRDKYQLTQIEAAERIGISAGTWISWENGFRAPSRLTLRLLKEHFPDEFE